MCDVSCFMYLPRNAAMKHSTSHMRHCLFQRCRSVIAHQHPNKGSLANLVPNICVLVEYDEHRMSSVSNGKEHERRGGIYCRLYRLQGHSLIHICTLLYVPS